MFWQGDYIFNRFTGRAMPQEKKWDHLGSIFYEKHTYKKNTDDSISCIISVRNLKNIRTLMCLFRSTLILVPTEQIP